MFHKCLVLFVILLIVVCTCTLFAYVGRVADQRLLEADTYDVVATNPVPTIVCVDEHIILWNPAMEFLTGRPASEMVGRKTTVMVPDEFDERHDQGVRRITNAPGFARGHSFVRLPIDTAYWGRQKLLATVSHLRRHDGRLIMTTRFEGAMMHQGIRWKDVETGKFWRAKLTVTEEIPKEKPDESKGEVTDKRS